MVAASRAERELVLEVDELIIKSSSSRASGTAVVEASMLELLDDLVEVAPRF